LERGSGARYARTAFYEPVRRGDRALAAAGAAIPGITLLQALSYNGWADGPPADHARAGLLALTIAVVAWVAVRATVPPRSRAWLALPWATAVLVLIPSNVLHYVRISHPVALSGALVIADDFERVTKPDPKKWVSETRGSASITFSGGAVVLTTQVGGGAFLDLTIPSRPDPNAEHWLPRGLHNDDYDERLVWEASFQPHTDFSVLLETRPLLVQATQFGLHLTYPNTEGQLTEHHVERPDLKDGRVRTYRLERTAGLIRLRIDELPAWVYPDAGRFEVVRFGETRPDSLHAGTLALHGVRYERRFLGHSRAVNASF
jgi:hypothetical protein